VVLKSFNSIVTRKFFFLLLACSLVLPAQSQRLSILFVGNSLTYSNNLPEIVTQIAACDSVKMTCKILAFPNYALEDHLYDGRVIAEIKSRAYDFVVVQQGPSSQQEGRAMLLNDGLKLAKLCAENKTKLAFFTVWPAKERFGDFPGVIESYKLAADSTKSLLCPAGSAWLKAWEVSPELLLYAGDNFHPGYRGSLLSALVIYGSIRKKNNLNFANYDAFAMNNLSNPEFKILLQAAQQTLAENKPAKKEKRK
jgi:hypothetical protein